MATQLLTLSELQAARRERAWAGLLSGEYRVEWIEPGESALVIRKARPDEPETAFMENGEVVRYVNKTLAMCPCEDQTYRGSRMGLRCLHICALDIEDEWFSKLMESFLQEVA